MIASNIFCHGASRFLGHVYMDDVTVSGTATLSSLSLTGALTVSGATTLNGETIVNAVTRLKAAVEIYGTTPYIDFHFGNSTADYTSRIIESASGTLTIPKSLTVSTLLTATTGAVTTLNTTTANATNLNVTNNLRATKFDLQTVSQVGGSLYVSPTLLFPNSGTKLTVAKSSTALTLTIKDSSISTGTMAGIVWTTGSSVKVSGTINGVATGTMDGTISSITNGSQMVLSVSGGNWSNVSATTTDLTSSQFSDLSVMVYQRKDGTNNYRVGIWANCYDTANSSSTIRVYGGTSASPNVIIGNLTNAGLGTVNGITPNGWGLYAQNAFLWGAIVSTEGQIGGWTIGDTKLFNGTNSMTSTTAGMYLGTDGFRNYASATTYTNITGGKITAIGADISGTLTATAGYIGGTSGWTINSQQLSSGTIGADNSMFLGTKNLGSNTEIAGREGSDWRLTVGSAFGVTNKGYLYCNGGTIAGWTLDSNSLSNGTWGTADSVMLCTGTKNAKIIGGSTSISGWVITAGNTFGVTKAGAVYATSGKIAGWTISANGIYMGDTGMSSDTASGHYAFWAGETNSKNGASDTNAKFKVGHDGILTATGAVIQGRIESVNGKIGGWTIGSDSIYTFNSGVNFALRAPDGGEPNIFIYDMTATSNIQSTVIGLGEISVNDPANSHSTTIQPSGISTVDISATGTIQTNGNVKSYLSDGKSSQLMVGSDNGLRVSNASDSNVFTFMVNASAYAGMYDASNGFWALRYNFNEKITFIGTGGCGLRIGAADSSGTLAVQPRTSTDGINNGNILLGTSGSRWKAVYAANGTIQTSDERLKKIHRYLGENHKDLFMSLRPFEYSFISDPSERHFGLGAQTTEEAMTKLGFGSEYRMVEHAYYDEEDAYGRHDMYSMNYTEAAVLAIPVVQEHEAEIQKLKARIAELEEKINRVH